MGNSFYTNDELQRHNAFLAAIVNSSDDAIVGKDLNSIISSWNKAAERIFGYTEEEMIGTSVYKLIPPELTYEEEMIIGKLKQGQRIDHHETIRVRKDGSKVQVALTISPIHDVTGVVIGASKIARDITREKQDAALLKEYATRLETISSVSRLINAQLNVDAILQKVTDATTKLSGAAFGAFFYNKTDSAGNSYMLYTLSGAPIEAFEKFGMPRNTAVFKPTFEGEGIVRSDDITKDPRYGHNNPHFGMPKGHLPVVSYLAVPVVSQTGIVIGGLFFGHSEPARFTAEHEHLVDAIASQAAITLDNAKLYEEVQALSKKKDEFIAFASHELKTPLTTISGYIQIAQKLSTLPPNFLQKIEGQVHRLNDIIEDLLNISRIQAGRLNLDFSEVSLNTVVRNSVAAAGVETHHIGLDLLAEDITVTVDRLKIEQVLVNIISNAAKYSMPGTSINIEVERMGDQVKISVQDEGTGIDAQHLGKIFQQFYRANSKHQIQGLGLGLYICREIIDLHMGRIWADSEPGKGSVFHISFPIDGIKEE